MTLPCPILLVFSLVAVASSRTASASAPSPPGGSLFCYPFLKTGGASPSPTGWWFLGSMRTSTPTDWRGHRPLRIRGYFRVCFFSHCRGRRPRRPTKKISGRRQRSRCELGKFVSQTSCTDPTGLRGQGAECPRMKFVLRAKLSSCRPPQRAASKKRLGRQSRPRRILRAVPLGFISLQVLFNLPRKAVSLLGVPQKRSSIQTLRPNRSLSVAGFQARLVFSQIFFYYSYFTYFTY